MAKVLASDIVVPEYTRGVGHAVIRLTARQNYLFEDKEATMKVHSRGRVSIVKLKQRPGTQVVNIPGFDYLVLKYSWMDDNGAGLDTATCFTNTGIPGVDDIFVGKTYLRTDMKNSVEGFLTHYADNTRNHEYSDVFDFKRLSQDSRIDKTVNSIDSDIYANWLGGRNSGKATLSIKAYLGGKMVDKITEAVNQGGREVYSRNIEVQISSFGKYNHQNIRSLYSRIGNITYDKDSKNCVLYIG